LGIFLPSPLVPLVGGGVRRLLECSVLREVRTRAGEWIRMRIRLDDHTPLMRV
jgi:hypothetical protein